MYSPFRENAHWRLISRPFPVHAARKNTERKANTANRTNYSKPFWGQARDFEMSARARKSPVFSSPGDLNEKTSQKLCVKLGVRQLLGLSILFSVIQVLKPDCDSASGQPTTSPTPHSLLGTLTLGKTTIFFPSDWTKNLLIVSRCLGSIWQGESVGKIWMIFNYSPTRHFRENFRVPSRKDFNYKPSHNWKKVKHTYVRTT